MDFDLSGQSEAWRKPLQAFFDQEVLPRHRAWVEHTASHRDVPPFMRDLQGKARAVLRLNPMTHLLVSYQQMLFDGSFDHWRGLAATAGVAVLTFALGAWLFDRLRDTLAEEV